MRLHTGGLGTFLRTLWHVVDAAYSWIRAIEGKPDLQFPFGDDAKVDEIRSFSNNCRGEIEQFLATWDPVRGSQIVQAAWRPGEVFTAGEVLRHVLAHEIHHMGQLSVWARQIGREPVSANLIGRQFG